MSISLPSRKFVILDVPEVKNISTEFVYNFFVRDEMVNDSGIVEQDLIESKPLTAFNNEFLDSANFRRFVPRFNRIEWDPSIFGNVTQAIPDIDLESNQDKIYDETTFSLEDYTYIKFQDDGADEKLAFFVRRAIEENEQREDDPRVNSPQDFAKKTNRFSSKEVKSNFVTKILTRLEQSGHMFLQKSRRRIQNQDDFIKEISEVNINTNINNRFLTKILKTVNENTINIFDDEVQKRREISEEIQQQAIANRPSSLFDAKDYDLEVLNFVDIEPIDADGFEPVVALVGYRINKKEITVDGEIIEHEPLFVQSPFVNTTADLKIRYGSKYEYNIQTIASFKTQAEDVEDGSIVALTFLASSQPSRTVSVTCEEFVPPPAVRDFNVDWDFHRNLLRLMWNFPINTQRDVKYFQVFRRRGIDQPFEMIRMYDFDDSEILPILNETPEPDLVETLDSAKTFYIDEEFTKDSRFIYAVCAIDAHGFSSPYSSQIEVAFNRSKNRLEKTLISPPGAPKAYPNIILFSDTFVDSIRNSNHKKLKVIFNPEYLKLVDNQNNDLQLLRTNSNNFYRLQLINVDLQEQQIINIGLKDQRQTAEIDIDEEDIDGEE